MTNKLILSTTFLLFFICTKIHAQNISLDLGFDTDGIATTNFEANDDAQSTAIQSDGKIVVVGYSFNALNDDFSIVRYNTDGSLDATFGTNGKVMTDINGTNDKAQSVVIQSDGKIVVAGFSKTGYSDYIVIVRYNNNGSLDNSFDTDGILTTTFRSLYANNVLTYNSLALQSDGKILLAYSTDGATLYDFAIARYNTDGSLDNTFDSDGKTSTDFAGGYDRPYAIAVQNNGQIILVGSEFSANTKIAIARYNTDGSLDNTFDIDGKAMLAIGTGVEVFSVAIQNDGKIVVFGYTQDSATYYSIVVRYNIDGTLDNSFDADGIVLTPAVYNAAYWLALQSDGKIVAASTILARYNTDGSLDSTFDSDGIVNTRGVSMAIQNNDKIVLVGIIEGTPSIRDFEVMRYNTDGSLDSSFDSDGNITTDIGNSYSLGSSVALQPDGKIVVAGHKHNHLYSWDLQESFAVVRYNADGSLDNSFGTNGRTFTRIHVNGQGEDVRGRCVAIQNDGKIIVGGSVTISVQNGAFINSFESAVIVRYNADGSLDSTFAGDGIIINYAPYYSVSSIYSMALQDDGKIILTGFINSGFVIYRYNTDGSLDNTFGINGIVGTRFGNGSSTGHSIAIQRDQKIVVAGKSSSDPNSWSYTFAIARYHTNGQLDSTFSTDGIVTTYIGGNDIAYSVVLQSDGKIIVSGRTYDVFALVRYNADGSLDNSFGEDGIVTTAIRDINTLPYGYGNDAAYSAVLQSAVLQCNEKILLAGRSQNGTDNDIALARYNTDGSLDNTFDGDGIAILDLNGNDIGNAVVLQSDDKIVVAGQSNNSFAVVRYNNTPIEVGNQACILNAYPNPARESMTIEIDICLVGFKYLIVNQLGQIVLAGTFNSGINSIDVSSLLQGVYYLQLVEEAQRVVKIVKY